MRVPCSRIPVNVGYVTDLDFKETHLACAVFGRNVRGTALCHSSALVVAILLTLFRAVRSESLAVQLCIARRQRSELCGKPYATLFESVEQLPDFACCMCVSSPVSLSDGAGYPLPTLHRRFELL